MEPIKEFYLQRNEDESGISGTEIVRRRTWKYGL
jgi:hypothetical protein